MTDDSDHDGGAVPRSPARMLAEVVTPAEVMALIVLLLGAAALTAVVWWLGQPRALDPHDVVEEVPEGGGEGLLVSTEPAGEVLVHVSGAVRAPGVVRVPEGARVIDAIHAAGGPGADAVLDGVNLAREVRDGEQVAVPTTVELSDGAIAGAASELSARLPDGRLDLNAATAVDLQELPGVGPVTAERIVAHREVLGRYDDVTQLLEVRGIGPSTFASIEPEVGV